MVHDPVLSGGRSAQRGRLRLASGGTGELAQSSDDRDAPRTGQRSGVRRLYDLDGNRDPFEFGQGLRGAVAAVVRHAAAVVRQADRVVAGIDEMRVPVTSELRSDNR